MKSVMALVYIADMECLPMDHPSSIHKSLYIPKPKGMPIDACEQRPLGRGTFRSPTCSLVVKQLMDHIDINIYINNISNINIPPENTMIWLRSKNKAAIQTSFTISTSYHAAFACVNTTPDHDRTQ